MPRSLIGKSGVLIPLCPKGHLGSTLIWAKIPAAAHNPLAYGAAEKRRHYNQMEKFVVVNGRILDFEKYRNDFSLMQKIISLDMREYLMKFGFKQISAKNKRLLQRRMGFYNKELDFEITMKANKKRKLQFI